MKPRFHGFGVRRKLVYEINTAELQISYAEHAKEVLLTRHDMGDVHCLVGELAPFFCVYPE